MKNLIYRSLAVGVTTAILTLNAHAELPDGQVDFGKFTAPGKGAEFVEVQIRTNLLSLAAKLVEKEQPDAAKVLRSVQLVRVNVVGLTDENRDELNKRIQKIRTELERQDWERNVNVLGKQGEDVRVYTKTRGAEALAGLAVTVIDTKNIVLVNIVGDIRPEQIAALGESLNIQPLKEIGAAIKK
jgi:Domain of unknown function (DUF4252)